MTLEHAKTEFLEGLACLETGRHAEAETHLQRSLALAPDRPSTLANLAATRLRLGRPLDALTVADRLIALEPDGFDGWFHRATALARLERRDEAVEAFSRVLAMPADDSGESFSNAVRADLWTQLGNVLRELGRLEEASDAFEKAIALGASGALPGFLLAAVRAGPAPLPETAPADYVRTLFDDYAPTFEQHLLQSLRYRGPKVLVDRIASLSTMLVASALDLGCGTGLCGPWLRPLTKRLTGVDLSPAMLALAATKETYDDLIEDEIVAYLQVTNLRHDIVVAADVFVYLGALETLFSGVRRVLERGGLFAFSAEEAAPDVERFALTSHLRYVHTEAYLLGPGLTAGFETIDCWREPIREENGKPVDGIYAVLRAG